MRSQCSHSRQLLVSWTFSWGSQPISRPGATGTHSGGTLWEGAGSSGRCGLSGAMATRRSLGPRRARRDESLGRVMGVMRGGVGSEGWAH